MKIALKFKIKFIRLQQSGPNNFQHIHRLLTMRYNNLDTNVGYF